MSGVRNRSLGIEFGSYSFSCSWHRSPYPLDLCLLPRFESTHQFFTTRDKQDVHTLPASIFFPTRLHFSCCFLLYKISTCNDILKILQTLRSESRTKNEFNPRPALATTPTPSMPPTNLSRMIISYALPTTVFLK